VLRIPDDRRLFGLGLESPLDWLAVIAG